MDFSNQTGIILISNHVHCWNWDYILICRRPMFFHVFLFTVFALIIAFEKERCNFQLLLQLALSKVLYFLPLLTKKKTDQLTRLFWFIDSSQILWKTQGIHWRKKRGGGKWLNGGRAINGANSVFRFFFKARMKVSLLTKCITLKTHSVKLEFVIASGKGKGKIRKRKRKPPQCFFFFFCIASKS